jgi:hypothetical protein
VLAVAGVVVLCAVLAVLFTPVAASAQPTPGPTQPAGAPTPQASASSGSPSPIPALTLARAAAGQLANFASSGLGSGTGGVVSMVFGPLQDSLLDGVSGVIDELGDFIDTTTQPQPMDASFLGPDGPYHQVALFSAALLIGFVFLGVAHGLLTGAPGQALARLVRDVPLALLAITSFPWIVGQLVNLSNGLSAAILPTGKTAKELLTTQLLENLKGLGTQNVVPAVLIGFLTFAATLLVYLELVVRVILLQLLEALAPLSFAPMVWAPARDAGRKVAELTVAIVLSQPAVFLGLRIGLDFLHQHATSSPLDLGAWGKLLLGLGVVTVAIFSPWVIWRLLPQAEGMLLAQGLSRSPARAAMSGLQTAYWVTAVRSSMGRRAAPSAGPSGAGVGPPRSLPPPGPGRAGGGGRPPAGSPPTAGTGGGSSLGGAAAAGMTPASTVASAFRARTGAAAAAPTAAPSGPGPAGSGPRQSPPKQAPVRRRPPNPPGQSSPSSQPGPSSPPGRAGRQRPAGSPGGGVAPGWSRRRPTG